ncbi:hypothetical protein AAH994_04030 [Weeksellaceae bacterium A-14]
MRSLRDFILNFLHHSGHYVFGSILISKIAGFVSSVVIIHLLSENDFGMVSIVNSLSLVFIALNGLGSHQILLRYGCISSMKKDQEALSGYVFWRGLLFEVFLMAVFLLTSIFYLRQYDHVFVLFVFFAMRLLGIYCFNHALGYLRVCGKNRQFSRVNNLVNIGGLVMMLLLSYFFGLYGYLASIALAPFFSVFWLNGIDRSRLFSDFPFPRTEMWRYGFLSALTGVLSDLLFSLDILLMGFYMNEAGVATYRTALLIPSNITFLALVFTQSDFPQIAKNYRNAIFLKNYIFNFYKIFIPLSLLIFLGSYFLKDFILHLFFGNKYAGLGLPFMIGILGFCISMVTRNLYGNMASAVGKMSYNTIGAVVSIALLTISSAFLVPRYQVAGMAWSMTIALTGGGVLMTLLFYSYCRKLQNQA